MFRILGRLNPFTGHGQCPQAIKRRHRARRPGVDGLERRTLLSLTGQFGQITSNVQRNTSVENFNYQTIQPPQPLAPINSSKTITVTNPNPNLTASVTTSLMSTIAADDASGSASLAGSFSPGASSFSTGNYNIQYEVTFTNSGASPETLTVNYTIESHAATPPRQTTASIGVDAVHGATNGSGTWIITIPHNGYTAISALINYAFDDPPTALTSSCSFSWKLTTTTASTKTTVVSSVDPSTFGQPVTFTATVSPASSGVPTPTGTVTFMDGLTNIGTGKINASGIATLLTSKLTVGNHLITADYSGDSNYSGSFGSVPQTVEAPPHVSIVSFAKDSASNSLTSNGDYDLTYLVSGSNLPNNPKLTVAVYWATSTTAASIIPNLPPVATGPLQQAVNSQPYTFPIHIAQLINPPAKATNLIAIIDPIHVLPASEETNTVVPLSTSGLPLDYLLLGDTWLSEPVSYELDSIAPALKVAITREQRVFLWIAQYANTIKATANVYDVDPRAIAGAIAWEALQNVQGSIGKLKNGYGPGKIHPSGDTLAVEGTNIYGHYLTIQPNLLGYLQDPTHAITYIAAIMNAYAVNAKAVGIDLRAVTNPTSKNPSSNAGILASYYNGVKDANGIQVNLANAHSYFINRIKTITNSPLTHNTWMGQWVDNNLAWLAKALGIP